MYTLFKLLKEFLTISSKIYNKVFFNNHILDNATVRHEYRQSSVQLKFSWQFCMIQNNILKINHHLQVFVWCVDWSDLTRFSNKIVCFKYY